MSGQAERFDERARREFAERGRTIVRRGELLRHPVYTRVLHWLVAISFVLSLLSGFGIYSPWLFRWLTPLFGGGSPPPSRSSSPRRQERSRSRHHTPSGVRLKNSPRPATASRPSTCTAE